MSGAAATAELLQGQIRLRAGRAPIGRGLNLQIEVPDVTAVHALVLAAGHEPVVALEERWYRAGDVEHGNRQFVIEDLDGYLLRPFQDLGTRPSEVDGREHRRVSEAEAIAGTAVPASVESLRADLRGLGLPAGAIVMAHTSLSRLSYVIGGSHAVVLALLAAVGSEGTLIMPTHSGDLGDPAEWVNPPGPEAWWPSMRDQMPAYHQALTPTRGV